MPTILTESQVARWNGIITTAILEGGQGLPIEFWQSMLILAPKTQEEVNQEYLENCPNKNCAVCVYLRGM